ncbi:unnamed protein product [Acanthocheilonema viteae]|uniref:[histone H3]-lysine(27) N-trimethyltransferase n=1 Tax=Acanthocheilonema viteae TaxID=6277 RepID=A0A498SRZ2_ACAVI|nr:unnamed protein product [Acanthocheilonema viteae]
MLSNHQFEDLKRRFGPSDLFAEDSSQSEFLDTKALHSFQLLLCNRCLTYDCLIHGVNATETEVRRRRGVTSVEPCGLQCFRHLTKEMEEAKRRCASPPDTKTINAILNIKTEDINWTAQQESMFIALRRTYKNDFCKLAEVLNLVVGNAPPKSCRELYAYSFRTAPISPRADVSPNSPPKKKKNMKDQHRTFRAVKWAKTEGKVGNTHVYEPCSHSGPCSVENNCSCVSVDNLCTKFCRCGEQCKYRFPGCRCAPGLCRTKQCQCFYANWECDPDVCKSCKCDVLDDPNVATCKNVAMQRGLQKKLVIAPSQVAGWGCFAEEDIEKNDFISEYCGEVISHDESERRGKIYDKLKCSYLFGLNDEMVVDATRKGNVIRFANHSKDPNCMAKVFMVNGDHRIGIFARRPIIAGEELFFDYSYNSYQQQVLKNEPALLKLTTPMNICGDINGHYHDLLRIFRSLPIAAVLANKIFCVHGGLINKIERLDHIKKLEPDEKPVLMKLMPTTGESNRNLSESIDDDIDNKLSEFGVDCIIRGHQVVNGYLLCRGGRVIILYSASSLHQSFNNLAAIAKISESLEVSFIKFHLCSLSNRDCQVHTQITP